jgi:Polyketide cyclase / dehydrase and lipid transport
MTQATNSWSASYSIDTTATPEAIFRLFEAVGSWNDWNSGVEHAELEGPFRAGTWFTMKPTGQDTLRSRLVEVNPNEGFVDETEAMGLVVRVAHRIAAAAAGSTRVTYSLEVAGDGADHIGPAIASDFPEVLTALTRLAEGNPQ